MAGSGGEQHIKARREGGEMKDALPPSRGLFPDSACIPNKGYNEMRLHDSDEGDFATAISRHADHVSYQSGMQEVGLSVRHKLGQCQRYLTLSSHTERAF